MRYTQFALRSLREGPTHLTWSPTEELTEEFVRKQGGWGLGATFALYNRPTAEARAFLATRYAARLRSLLR